MSNRRDLHFHDWDEVITDLRALSAGYNQQGNWSLEQAARHLNDWLSFPMNGFPDPPWLIRIMMSLIRVTVGKSMLKKILASGKMKDGGPTVPQTVYESSGEVGGETAVAQLIETIERFREFDGQIHASPIFGPMDKQTAEQLQWVHFAHHLSWLTPKPA